MEGKGRPVSLTHQGTNSVRLKWLPLRSKSVSLNLASSPRTLREDSLRTSTEGGWNYTRGIKRGYSDFARGKWFVDVICELSLTTRCVRPCQLSVTLTRMEGV